jgi:predicted AAA+ superfamily ATPase
VARIKDSKDVAKLLELLAHRTAELLNVSSLANDLQEDRLTVARHLAILEKLFLVRTLPAWHRNSAKRLIKAPKVHLCDPGLAATLVDLHADDWNAKRNRFGHLLESFVLQQLVAQAGWTDPDLRFWHYRDKDQVEVDCVITRGRKVWGVEVKASATVHPSDGKGLRRLAEQARDDFQGGIVLYDGDAVLALGDAGLLAVPLSRLWD